MVEESKMVKDDQDIIKKVRAIEPEAGIHCTDYGEKWPKETRYLIYLGMGSRGKKYFTGESWEVCLEKIQKDKDGARRPA